MRAKQKLDSNGYLTGIAEVTFPDGETVYADKPTWLKELKATFERKSGDWNIARSRLNTVVQTLPGMVGLIE